MECPICVNSSESIITCFACSNIACSKCVETYLLSIGEIPNCMHCKKEWSLNFVYSNMKTFAKKEYLKHRANIRFQNEFTRLPEEQERARLLIALNNARKAYDEASRAWNEFSKNVALKKTKKNVERYLGNCPYPNSTGFIGSNYRCGLCEKKT